MILRSPTPITLLTAALLIIFVAWPLSGAAEAKGRKSRSASRSKSSKRSSAKRAQRRSNKVAADREMAVIPETYPIAPDRIEVIEGAAASAPEMSRYLNPPLPRSQPRQDSSNAEPSLLPKRKGLKIDESRALQIQQALKQRGFHTGEMTGVYDQETFKAMLRFQTAEKIPATGYPTAHALKRLGL